MYRFGIGMVALLLGIAVLGSTDVVGKNMDEEVMCIPMGEIVLEPPASVEQTRKAVAFPHSLHFGIQCQSCHHTWGGQDYIQNCMTAGCHDLTESPVKTKKGDPHQYYKNAYHQMCIGCHKTTRLENQKLEASGRLLKDQLPKSGPTSCLGCHPEY